MNIQNRQRFEENCQNWRKKLSDNFIQTFDDIAATFDNLVQTIDDFVQIFNVEISDVKFFLCPEISLTVFEIY